MAGRPSPWWAAVGAALLLAALAALADHRQRRRADPDAVGPIDWRTVQMVALIGAALAGMLALHD